MHNLLKTLKDSYPIYNTKQPSTGKVLTYRPFTVKEEKSLLLSKETGLYADFLSTIADIVNSCYSQNSIKINARNLPIFDVEYLFLKIREKSVSEKINVSFVCPETKETIKIEIEIPGIELKTKEVNKNVKISNDIIVNMRYPTFNYLIENSLKTNDGNIDLFDMVINSIESIQTKEDLLTNLDYQTLVDFIDGLTKQQYQEILNFFINMPKMEHTVPYFASDGVERKITFRGIKDFFR